MSQFTRLIDVHPSTRMRVRGRCDAESVSIWLRCNVAIGSSQLTLVAQAPVEVAGVTFAKPEVVDAFLKAIVYEFGYRAVKSLHERGECSSDCDVSDQVIVVAQEGCGNEFNSVVPGPVIESIPKD